ncbi:MAG: tetratricopeptide repeat protein, partial [Bacteroidia bacterium]|nr:tetratricopeptide repeat protein [Bacteroidia bacterium]
MFLLSSCTNKKNTVVTRNYHNLTSRFNGLFNAKEIYKEGVKKLNISAKENYETILPLYNYGTQAESKTITQDMDKCYKKASSVIERHSIRIRGKEYCKWIDETYLLIGKSHLYKHDYFLAIEAFNYVADQFKKEPTAYEAKIWKIRALNEVGSLSESMDLIDEIKSDKKFPKKKFAEQMAAAEADMYLRQKNNAPAISWLKKALKYTKSKENKIRYNFILAQLYQDQNENRKALSCYETVLKLHPKYEMAFYAHLNKSKVMESNAKNSQSVKKDLLKMAKDGKNEEYKDQIYYTLAEITLKEGQPDDAIDFLKRSIKESKANVKQKGKSCLLMADIYYEKPNYIKAQQFYDSAATFLPKEFYGYSTIETKKNILGKLVAYLDTVRSSDSLIKLSNLSDSEVDKIVQKEIDKKVKEYYALKKAAKEAAEKAEKNANNPTIPGGGITDPSVSAAWYFYNPTTLGLGIAEFTKKWGNRKLEDNWRRANKAMVITADDTGKTVEEPVLTEEELDQQAIEKIKEPTQYLNKIPKGSESVATNEKSVANAYYNIGVIYTQQLSNNEKGAEAFETLIDRFPNHADKLTIYYQLYRIYTNTGEAKKAEKYKNLLIQSDPQGEYTQLINNPDYNGASNSPKSKVAKYYEETYNNYLKGNYASVITDCNTAVKQYQGNYLVPKFDFLKALSVGKTEGVDALEKSLKEIVLKYPGNPIRDEAQNLLTIIATYKKNNSADLYDPTQNKANTDTIANPITVKPSPFTFKDTTHYYLLVYPKTLKDGAQLSARVTDFNNTFFSLYELTLTTIMLGDDNAILVRSFENKFKAMDFFNTIKNNTGVFNG